jgi:hypothetical protein
MKVLSYLSDMATNNVVMGLYASLQLLAMVRKERWGVLVPRKVA